MMLLTVVLLSVSLGTAVARDTCAKFQGPCFPGSGICPGGMKCINPGDPSEECCLITDIRTPSPGCVDLVNPSTKVSDCPRMASYCNNSAYFTMMTQQCPQTCGRCGGSGSGGCVDKINLSTGRSDCPGMVSYCNNSAYYTLMTEQCPSTCGRCPG